LPSGLNAALRRLIPPSEDDNKDFIILPGSIPLHDGSCRNELVYYLPGGWDPVIERDIDGDRAETTTS
jgi:predicted AAA+ superfamily ATPase